jgi:hypothetical protein
LFNLAIDSKLRGRQLSQYGMVARITNDDGVAFNAPPTNDPVAQCVAFARMWDPMGMVGWNANGAGHGFTLVNENDWQGAVGSAILSHLGFRAPLLLVNDPNKLPAQVSNYLAVVAPTIPRLPRRRSLQHGVRRRRLCAHLLASTG